MYTSGKSSTTKRTKGPIVPLGELKGGEALSVALHPWIAVFAIKRSRIRPIEQQDNASQSTLGCIIWIWIVVDTRSPLSGHVQVLQGFYVQFRRWWRGWRPALVSTHQGVTVLKLSEDKESERVLFNPNTRPGNTLSSSSTSTNSIASMSLSTSPCPGPIWCSFLSITVSTISHIPTRLFPSKGGGPLSSQSAHSKGAWVSEAESALIPI